MSGGGPRRDGNPRALFLIRNLETGGAERVFTLYMNQMERIDPVPVLQAPVRSAANRLRPDREALSLGGGEGGRRFPLAARVREAARLARIARREEYGLLCSFLLKSHRVAALARIFFLPGVPLVVCAHEMLSEHLESAHAGTLSRTVHRWIARLVLGEADRILAVSEGVRRDLVDRLGAPPERVVTIPNPVDREAILAAADRPPSVDPWGGGTGLRVAGLGRLARVKGFDLLLQAAASPAFPSGARIALIGDGPERTSLEDRAGRLGPGRWVRFTGFLDDPWPALARADLLVLPSREDAAPNVLVEAMILGVPVIAADCSPGVRELLAGGEAGLLVPPEDPEALAAAVARLHGDRALRERLAARASERVRTRDLHGAVRLFEDALLPLLARP